MNSLDRQITFNKIWEIWPKQEKESSAQKGFNLVCDGNNINSERLITAAKIYVSELKDVKYCHELGNWFRNDHYLDIYSHFDEINDYEAKLDRLDNLAKKLVTAWNDSCKSHWLPVKAFDERAQTAKDALQNKFFKENWEESLKVLSKVFKEKFPIGDWRRSTTPSFPWFCKTSYEFHTVARILEGEFGSAHIKQKEKPTPSFIPQSPDETELTINEILDGLQDTRDSKKPKSGKRDFGFD